MANTSSRTLRLLSLLQAQRYWPGSDLAERLGVSVRTLRRDVDRLRELGYPVEAQPGVDGGYQLSAGAALPPLALDDEEAVALAVGLQATSSSAVAGMAEPSLRALAKIVQVMPPRLRRRVDALRLVTESGSWGPSVGPDATVLMVLSQACRDSEGLAMEYVAADGAATSRVVEPHRLVSLGQRWYLVAYDLDRHDWRSFRVDRVRASSANGRRFRPRTLPAEDAVAFVRDAIVSAPSSSDVQAVLALPAADAEARLGRWAQVEELGDGRCRITMSAQSLEWAAFALGISGAAVSEVSPPSLVDLLEEWAGRFSSARS